MEAEIEKAPSKEQESMFHEFTVELWRGKWIFMLCLLVVVFAGGGWLLLQKPYYTAEMIIAPEPSSPQQSGGRLSGLSALSGQFNLGSDSGPTPTFSQFLEIISSAIIADKFMADSQVLTAFFPSEWDPKTSTWHPPSGIIKRVNYGAMELFGFPGWIPPGAKELSAKLKAEVALETVSDTSMRKIRFTSNSREFSIKFLQRLYSLTDEIIRQESKSRATRQIEYLEEKLSSVSSIDHRQSLLALLSNKEKTMMMLHYGDGYAATILQPPYASDRPTGPLVLKTLMISLVVGLILGLFVVLSTAGIRWASKDNP